MVEAAGAVVAHPTTAPTTKETATTHQCPRNMLGRSRCMGASRNLPTARATSPTRASSNRTTRASTAATARRRASRKATATGRAATPTPTPTTPLVVVGALTTATTANSVSWLPVSTSWLGVAKSPALARNCEVLWDSESREKPGSITVGHRYLPCLHLWYR